MNYSRMAHADADELIRGKRVVVVGSGKSGLDTVSHCAEANGEHKETVDFLFFVVPAFFKMAEEYHGLSLSYLM
jgi:cation diffusion facilitator CzcD-associated flavoprotein CzcO